MMHVQKCSIPAAICMLTLGSLAHGEIIAADQFSLSDTVTAGQTVVGRTTSGTGHLAWDGSTSWLLADDTRSDVATEGIMRTNGSTTIGVGLPFAMSNYSQYGSTVKVSFSSFYRHTTSSTSGRMSFGFSNASGYSLNATTGAIWVQINTIDLTWNLQSSALNNGSGGSVASGALPSGITQYTWVDYSLTYDNATHTVVDFSINGTSLVSNVVLSQAPTDFNKFVILAQLPYSTATGSGFDNFSLEVIPEPASLGVLGLGCAGLIGFRGRHGKQ